eukprot:1786261-Amphidinium_carterae.1
MAEKCFKGTKDEREMLIAAILAQSSYIDELMTTTKELFVLKDVDAASLKDAIYQYNILASELRFRFGATLLFHFT